jgi:hypothetical protein
MSINVENADINGLIELMVKIGQFLKDVLDVKHQVGYK